MADAASAGGVVLAEEPHVAIGDGGALQTARASAMVGSTPSEAATTRIQSFWRRSLAYYKVRKMVQLHRDELEAMQQKTVSVGGKRVQPWSAESAELALRELNGKVSKNGTVLWPKGTVEKLLMERSALAYS